MLPASPVVHAHQPKQPEKEVEVEKPAEGQLSESEVPEATQAQPTQAAAQPTGETVKDGGSDSQAAEKPKAERRKQQKPS